MWINFSINILLKYCDNSTKDTRCWEEETKARMRVWWPTALAELDYHLAVASGTLKLWNMSISDCNYSRNCCRNYSYISARTAETLKLWNMSISDHNYSCNSCRNYSNISARTAETLKQQQLELEGPSTELIPLPTAKQLALSNGESEVHNAHQ